MSLPSFFNDHSNLVGQQICYNSYSPYPYRIEYKIWLAVVELVVETKKYMIFQNQSKSHCPITTERACNMKMEITQHITKVWQATTPKNE